MYNRSSPKYEIITEKFSLEISPSKTTLITFTNPTNYFALCGSSHEFDYIFSDGILLTLLYNKRFNRRTNRVSFDFGGIAHDVFRHAEVQSLSLAIIGATEQENHVAVKRIKEKYRNLNVVHAISGYKSRKLILEKLKLQPVDIIICGMGSPLQENFLIECKSILSNNFTGFTCGGFLTQTALSEKYYTDFVNKYHLRWLVRMVRHQHVRDKLFIDYPKFLIKWYVGLR
ncbi:WecB/TagA/CpsF family glycosyltransferase [Lentibacter algarum]|uniref:WecB/TagA/CpsF family glycosyltransferase n=1 Tax=Lentibacter algarum TaxID=576131 RepID=UPI00249216D6|nr:WecB/TagA/CpsF family glycosyltransferase [Lentibacter algarum]